VVLGRVLIEVPGGRMADWQKWDATTWMATDSIPRVGPDGPALTTLYLQVELDEERNEFNERNVADEPDECFYQWWISTSETDLPCSDGTIDQGFSIGLDSTISACEEAAEQVIELERG